MADLVVSENLYDNKGKLRRQIALDPRYETVRQIRSLLTSLEFELMEPEPNAKTLHETADGASILLLAAFPKGE